MKEKIKETLVELANVLEEKFKGKTEITEDDEIIETYFTRSFSNCYLENTYGQNIKHNISDGYGSRIINIDGIEYAYLNTYGQEDDWYEQELKFDIILISNKTINIITKCISEEFNFYFCEIKHPKFDIRELGGKRAYYFNNENQEVKLRYTPEYYYKYFGKEFQTPGSEKECSGEKLKFKLAEIK